MSLILMIAAGILLAFILLPLLGPIAMIAVCIATVALIGYGIIYSIGASMAAVEAAKNAVKKAQNAKALSFKTRVQAASEYQYALSAIRELMALQGLQRSPVGLWYQYVLTDRIRNCAMRGIFRVEDGLNRANLEKYLQKSSSRVQPADRSCAEELCRRILACHDGMCSQYQPPKPNTAK